MFQKILSWVREVIKKMIGLSTIKQTLDVDVAISTDMANALQVWSLMYENKSPWLSKDIRSMGLPAAIAGEIAGSVTLEFKVKFSGSARASYLSKQFDKILPKLTEQIEKGCAKGGLMIKPYINDDRIAVDFVQADMFYPVEFDSDGDIVSCIFADQKTVGNKFYTRLEFHKMTPAGCEIRNLAFRSDSRSSLGIQIPLTSVPDWAGILPEATITGIDKPLYAYFRYPLANNIDVTSPLGASCYSRAVELVEDADKQWSNLIWEFESGKRAIYVDVQAFNKDKTTGKPIIPDKRLYRTLEGMEPTEIGKEGFFKDWSPDFRDASIISGLDAILKRIEFTCGLAYGTLSDPQTVDKTATEVKASKQRSYATIKKTQKALQSTLDQLLYAMDVWVTLGNLAPRGTYTATYDFDDSVLTDSDEQIEQDKTAVDMKAMPKYIYLMRNYGIDEETAKKWVAEADQEDYNQNVPEEWYETSAKTEATEGQAVEQNG